MQLPDKLFSADHPESLLEKYFITLDTVTDKSWTFGSLLHFFTPNYTMVITWEKFERGKSWICIVFYGSFYILDEDICQLR